MAFTQPTLGLGPLIRGTVRGKAMVGVDALFKTTVVGPINRNQAIRALPLHGRGGVEIVSFKFPAFGLRVVQRDQQFTIAGHGGVKMRVGAIFGAIKAAHRVGPTGVEAAFGA